MKLERDKMLLSKKIRMTGVAIAFVMLVVIPAIKCENARLEILPIMKHHKIAEGKAAVLTCQANIPDANLLSPLEWKDPRGYTIREARAGDRPEIYTGALLGRMSRLLYIKSMTRAMVGEYTCEASYASTERLNASIFIESYVAITWKNAAENQYATKGTDYKVMCDVYAEPPPNVDWTKDNEPIENGDRYVIQTNGLLIKNVQESDDGTYTCRAVVMINGQMEERNIKLEVNIAPDFDEREKSIKVKEGESASISCKANGKPPPEYNWIRDNNKEDLAHSPRFTVNKITGLLTISKVEAGDYGAYVCIASNIAGQNETRLQVNVIVPPKIFELYNKTAEERQEGLLECKATGRPAPVITFRKHSKEQPYTLGSQEDDRRITIESRSTDTGDQMQTIASISISNLNRSDDGLYECIAKNEGGAAYKNGHLTVHFKPTFESMPKVPIWSWNAQPVNLSCLAESIPNATIKWRFRNVDLFESPQIKIHGSGPLSYITLIPTDRQLYGHYKCIATNTLGEAEHDIDFREAFAPGPVQQATPTIVTATSIKFTIVGPAEDFNPPIIAYRVQYKEQTNFDWNFGRNRTWSINSPYIVEELRPTITYDFRFAAINQVGQGVWNAPTSVTTQRRSPPEPPKWRDVISETSLMRGTFADRYELRWKVPADNGEPIQSYHIEYCPVHKVNGEWKQMQDAECVKRELKSPDIISQEIYPLRPDTKYRVQLRAQNILGYSLPAELYIQTAVGEYTNDMSNEVPLRAGFYDVYTSLDPSHGNTGGCESKLVSFSLVFISVMLSFV